MRVVAVPVQFRTVAAALASGPRRGHHRRRRAAADDPPRCASSAAASPASTTRGTRGSAALTEAEYFAHEHVIVSYNGDLRGIVEDMFGKHARIRCSVSSFANLGALVEGTAMLATIPELVADAHPRDATAPRGRSRCRSRSTRLRTRSCSGRVATDDDEPCRFVRAKIVEIAAALASA